MSLIELHQISKVHALGQQDVPALRDVSLAIEPGEFVAITGPSGSGKSTLLNILGCLDRPTDGSYRFKDQNVVSLSSDQLARLRNRHLGYVFQNFGLLPRLTAQENLELPLRYRGIGKKERGETSRLFLKAFSLAERHRHMPTQLSGGEQQRLAIARAVIGEPDVLFADEPTGALDSKTGASILSLFQRLNKTGLTIILVTHEETIANNAGRIIAIKDGAIQSDRNGRRSAPLGESP